MSIHHKVTEMLEFILKHATRFELDLLGEALRKRRERESSLGQMDFNNMARTMAEDFTKQMGLDSDNIQNMSRRLVSEMIQREAPDITERDINTLLDKWVPGKGAKKASALPKEMILAMITQFISYSSGKMTEKEKRQFPKGWEEKYWNAFQPEIQILVKNYLTDKIGKNEFWGGIREYLNAMK